MGNIVGRILNYYFGDVRGKKKNSTSLEPACKMMYEKTKSPRRVAYLKKMKRESARLKTFFKTPKWPLSFVNPKELARSGFFYVFNEDKVACAFCFGVIGEWIQGDIPMIEHKRHFPRCSFVRGLAVDNIPISGSNKISVIQDPVDYSFAWQWESNQETSQHVAQTTLPVENNQIIENMENGVICKLCLQRRMKLV